MSQPPVILQQCTPKFLIDTALINPGLLEPCKGAVNYAAKVSNDSGIDVQLCQQAGKVVLITAKLKERADDPVTIRGNNIGPLDWNKDHPAISEKTVDFFSKTFTFPVSPNEMDKEIEFKFCKINQNGDVSWSANNNFTRNLSNFGHFAVIEVDNVSFA